MLNTRKEILEAALSLAAVADGRDVSLDAVARRAGISKQAVIYHFPSKAALREGISDHIAGLWQLRLEERMGVPIAESSLADRVRAYARVVTSGHFAYGEVAAFSEILYRAGTDPLSRWFRLWISIPESLPDPEYERLALARLAATALWITHVMKADPMSAESIQRVLHQIDLLTESAA